MPEKKRRAYWQLTAFPNRFELCTSRLNPPYYQLQPWVLKLRAASTGSAQGVISKKQLESIPFKIVSYTQQQRIVAKIEELFSHIDAGIDAFKKAKQLLKQYRQSVLKAAVTGELLGKSFSNEIYKSIDHGLESLGQGWSPRCENEPSTSEESWAVIKTTAVQPLQYLEEENKRLPPGLNPRPHLEIKAGDILITRAGPRVRVGICCLVKETRKNLMICDKVYRLRTNRELVLPEYLELVLNSPQTQQNIEKLKTGINDSGVNLTQQRFVELQIPYPSIEEQKEIMDIIQDKEYAVMRLTHDLDDQISKAEKNKQSVLASAFSGQLIPQG